MFSCRGTEAQKKTSTLCLCVSAAFFVAVISIRSVSSTQAPPTFASKVEAVRVDVLVTSRGEPVRGLTAADFEILDNGVPQRVDLVSFEQIPLNVVLAFDMSDSVAGERLEHLRTAGAAVLAGLKREDQSALLTFSHIIQLRAPLSGNVARVREALASAAGAGQTALIDGVYAAMMTGEGDVGRCLVIVFSDGVDTSSWLTPDAVLESARRSNAVVYAVAVRSRLKAEFLRDVTSATGGQLFEVEKTARLEATFLSILDEFRHRYLVSYTPRGVPQGGWHRLTVRVNRSAKVQARPGYLAGS